MYKIDNYREHTLEHGNTPQCSVVTYVGRQSRKEGIYIHVQLIHFAIQEKATQHNYTPIKIN